MHSPLAVWLVTALPTMAAAGKAPRTPTSAFDFSVQKEAPPKKGFLKRILDQVDGGDFHGYDNVDGTSHKAENYLRTSTVRYKFHF
jgi:hypothetical protein